MQVRKVSQSRSWRSIFVAAAVCLCWLPASRPIRAETPAASTQPHAEVGKPTDAPMLWAIKGTDGKHSYLMGTIHLPDERVSTLPEVVEKALAASDAVYCEIPFDAASMMKVQTGLMRTDGKTLADALPADVYQRADSYLKKRGMSLKALQGLSTIGAATILVLADYLQHFQTRPALDQLIWQKAVAADKELGGLETADEQLALFLSLTEPEQVRLFARTLKQCEEADAGGQSISDKLVRAYVAGDPLALLDLMFKYLDKNDPVEMKFYERLLDKRNAIMAERIARHLRENPTKSYFFAVGAGHVPGEKGVIKLLEDAGLKLKRLSRQDAADIPAPAVGG